MSLREFVETLRDAGQIVTIREEVDWKYEIGRRTRQTQRSGCNHKALLFENIPGHAGHRVFTNGLGTYSRFGLALGLDAEQSFADVVSVFGERMAHPIAPVLVSDGPVKQNVVAGEQADLSQLPVPWWSPKDGGRYVGTWHLNITNDPATAVRNVGVYRMQLLGPRLTTVSVSPRSHLARHIAEAARQGQPLEMAVGIGVGEALVMAAACALPYGLDEFDVAGGLAQKPVELVNCETVDVWVPADSEIVIEGTIDPAARAKDGPFLDYSGVANTDSQAYVFRVTGMMFRDEPIFRGAAIGAPGAEDHILLSIISSANCLDFHGSKVRQRVQNALLRRRLFGPFQLTGRLGHLLRKAGL